MPVYLVRLQKTEPQDRLIEAPNQVAAERFATKDWVTTVKPKVADLVRLGKAGVEVEQVTPAAEDKAAEAK